MRVLGVFAHPDDECIFGWPIFQNTKIEKRLIMVASDRTNPARQWCSQRGDALREICQHYRIALTCLEFDSEFYRMPYRRAAVVLLDLYRQTREAIGAVHDEFQPHFVFCHNPHGEYGMFDHRIVFDIVYGHAAVENLAVTDICERHQGWPSFDAIPGPEWELYYRDKPRVDLTLNPDFYLFCKAVYDRYGCWTWKKKLPPVYPKAHCGLYFLRAGSAFDINPVAEVLSGDRRDAEVS